MFITDIQKGKSHKYRVFGDGQYLFSLYGKELKQFHLQQDAEVEDSVITNILDTVIYKRAKERALFLLERKPVSVQMMRDKLRNSEYTEEVINRVIQFLEQYQYLDDAEYTRLYISSYAERKSKKQIMRNLYGKGIAKEIVETCFDESAYSEQYCFSKQFEKYVQGKNLQDYATKQKVFRYFYGKGFSSSLITAYMKRSEE